MNPSLQDELKHSRFEGILLDGITCLELVYPGFDHKVLLHAGPPLAPGGTPQSVRNAAINALLFEGLAASATEAEALLESGEIALQPAQEWGVATPLAQVVSASMPLFAAGRGESRAYAPVLEGAPPALRFGSPDPVCVDNLRRHADHAHRELAGSLSRSPVRLDTLVEMALSQGDECHSLTDHANRALYQQLTGLSDTYRTLLANTPGFVLPVLMAACDWRLKYGNGAIDAVGGNGQCFGMRLRGETDWITIPAGVPTGPQGTGQRPLGAIGDSAVIDFCGLGGQAIESAPALVEQWQDLLPEDWASRSASILDPDSGMVCPIRVNRQQTPPIINLAILDAGPGGGILGKGFYQPDLALFADVAERLS